MDTKDLRSTLQRQSMEEGRPIQRFLGADTKGTVDHALAGDTDKERLGEGFDERAELGKELIVLRRGLAEAEARVEDDVVDAELEELSYPLGKVVDHFERDVAVACLLLHRLRVALHVHQYIGHLELCHRPIHRWIKASP